MQSWFDTVKSAATAVQSRAAEYIQENKLMAQEGEESYYDEEEAGDSDEPNAEKEVSIKVNKKPQAAAQQEGPTAKAREPREPPA